MGNDIHAGPGTTGQVSSEAFQRYAEYFSRSPETVADKLSDFTKYVPREALGRALVKYEIFKRVLGIQGSVVECGVFGGAGLMAFAQFSEMLEPLNHQRKIVGFDTFAGFPSLSDKDQPLVSADVHQVGDLARNSLADLQAGIALWNSTRYLKHIPKVMLVPGNMTETIPHFIQENPHFIVSLLYLDADLYEPTRAALEHFVPRMPRGAIIAFDELNHPYWPGETMAVLETIGIRKLKLERHFATSISFAVLD